jgi:hypothetical protein
MSQHRFATQTSSGRKVEVTIGYDRPLNGFFLVVSVAALDTAAIADLYDAADGDDDDGDVFIYSNLDDVDLIDLGGLTLDLQYFKSKLALLGIALAPSIEHELQEDRRLRVGNRVCVYDGAGQALPGSEV